MTDQYQYKNFSTRRFRADLHYRLRLVALQMNVTQEEAMNIVVENGLGVVEASLAKQEREYQGVKGSIPTRA